ncbi:MAG: hypothetical protein ACK5M4_10935, partial [Pseudorhodobacter sp.]
VSRFVAANEIAVNNYQPRPYPGRITVIRARDDVFDSDRAITEGLGWAGVAEGGVEVIDAEGGHLSILREPGVIEVAQAFSRIMEGG